MLPALTLAPRFPAVPLPWPLLAALFALTELVVLRVPLRREVQAVSLTEIVTVPALLLAGPGALLLGRVVGVLAVQLLHRRTPPHKAAFNTALAAAEAAVAIHVFLLLGGPAAGRPARPGPRPPRRCCAPGCWARPRCRSSWRCTTTPRCPSPGCGRPGSTRSPGCPRRWSAWSRVSA